MDKLTASSWRHLSSRIDASQNFVLALDGGGVLEARYVHRDGSEYFICYLSPSAGCAQLCRMCHLTATRQLSTYEADVEQLVQQASSVFAHYDREARNERPISHVNFNIMARGDALGGPAFSANWVETRLRLKALADVRQLTSSFNISTIFPEASADVDIAHVFHQSDVMFYYSLYSLQAKFRKRWLPRAQDPLIALSRLKRWQERTGREVCLHWALIAGENDSLTEAEEIGRTIEDFGLRAKFNLVRYNSAGPNRGNESTEERVEAYFKVLTEILKSPESRIVPRVGYDVKASCGMFVVPEL